MQYKTLSLFLLAATALAAPEAVPEADVEKRQSDYYSSLIADLNNIDLSWTKYLTETDGANLAANTDLGDFGGTTRTPGNIPTNVVSIPTRPVNDIAFTAPPPPALTYANMPPPSIASVLMTAIPSSYMSEMLNPTARASVIREIQQGHFPDWYKKLPDNVKQWLSANYASMTATGTGAGAGAAAAATGTSHNAAPAPTGAMAASIAGAAGILGLALAL